MLPINSSKKYFGNDCSTRNDTLISLGQVVTVIGGSSRLEYYIDIDLDTPQYVKVIRYPVTMAIGAFELLELDAEFPDDLLFMNTFGADVTCSAFGKTR